MLTAPATIIHQKYQNKTSQQHQGQTKKLPRRSCTWNQDHLGIAQLWQNLAICPKKCRENVSFQPDGIRSNTSPETCQVNDADSLGQVEMLGARRVGNSTCARINNCDINFQQCGWNPRKGCCFVQTNWLVGFEGSVLIHP